MKYGGEEQKMSKKELDMSFLCPLINAVIELMESLPKESVLKILRVIQGIACATKNQSLCDIITVIVKVVEVFPDEAVLEILEVIKGAICDE